MIYILFNSTSFLDRLQGNRRSPRLRDIKTIQKKTFQRGIAEEVECSIKNTGIFNLKEKNILNQYKTYVKSFTWCFQHIQNSRIGFDIKFRICFICRRKVKTSKSRAQQKNKSYLAALLDEATFPISTLPRFLSKVSSQNL